MNDELERMWREVFIAYFMVLPQNVPGQTEKNDEKSQSG
jgi:hypothetical protein